ncbi:MAG: DUF4445 domain-containing protein [Planctomycetes bacterium]|nr:DUF4445 domain-containing protein [Planctomycetota bacterium]
MEHFNVIFEPDGRQVSIHSGATIFEAAGRVGIILNTLCGGKGICGKCAVSIGSEKRKVLACQYHINSDLTVTVPDSSRFYISGKILSEGVSSKTAIVPDVYEKYSAIDLAGNIFGVAIDIGTTTIVAKLFSLKSGQHLTTATALNPQRQFGADCISRISFAQTDEDLATLHTSIINCINELLAELCSGAEIDIQQIYEICAVGNTTMNHIFLKLPIAGLGCSPYKPFSVAAKNTPAAALGLAVNSAANVYTPENIAGFVGSDTLAAAIAVDMDLSSGKNLLLDIGTNGEIVLGVDGKIYAASCAAGPAFEGAGITFGSAAVEGALEAVVADGDEITIDVIGGGEAKSICGSGLLDAVAVLLDLAVIDSSGRFVNPDKLLPAIRSRIVERDDAPAFVFTDDVLLTQKDIRMVQLAKGAVAAGVKILLGKVGIDESDLERVFLAGAFGSYIRKESALRLRLLPAVDKCRIIFTGNAACSGAELLLISELIRVRASRLAQRVEYIDIAAEQNFQDIFTDCMKF